MAKRRGFGRGLGTASKTIGEFISAYIKQGLTEDSQNRQYNLQARNQASLADQQHGYNTDEIGLAQLLKDPALADRLRGNNPNTRVGTLNPSDYRTTANEAVRGLYKDNIGSANSRETLPGQQTLRMLAQNTPALQEDGAAQGIDEVLKMGAEADTRFVEELQAKQNEKDRVMPEKGVGAEGFINRQGNPVQTKYSGLEQGLAAHDTAITGDLSEDVLGIKTRQAGAEAGARQTATTMSDAGHLDELAAIARAKYINPNAAGNNIDLIMGPALRMVELAQSINTNDSVGGIEDIPGEIGYQVGDRLGGSIASAMKSNPAIVELESLRNQYAPRIARLLGHTGVLTQKDVDSALEGAPSRGLRRGDSDTRNKNFMAMIEAASRMGSTLPPIDPTLPQESQSAEFQRRMGLVRQSLAGQRALIGTPVQAGQPMGDTLEIGPNGEIYQKAR